MGEEPNSRARILRLRILDIEAQERGVVAEFSPGLLRLAP
jgi:hypothetical protein